MKAFYAIAVAAAIIAAANAKATIQEEHPITWYDCSKKNDGNYVHPTDCTRFISCSGGVASQRDCANCDVEPGRCPPEGRLIYNSTLDACLWADQTRCVTEDNNSADPTTTRRPRPTTEEKNQNSTTTPGPVVEPVEGGECNPEDCRNVGYCQSYLRCDKNSSVWVKEECGENLAWNPLNRNGSKQVHGGNCDIWANLRPEVEREYRTDPECLACFWRATGECNRDYDYQPPNGTHRNVLRLSCSEGLVFSEEKETCQRCQDVERNGGGNCCGGPTTAIPETTITELSSAS